MGYGLKITNPSGELVISSDAKGLHCIGRAALVGAVTQPFGTATAAAPGRQWGSSLYRISHAGPIICAIDLPLNKRVGILSVAESAAGVWDILAYSGDSADAYGFDTRYEVDVWAYGFPTDAPSGWGMAIWDAGHTIAYDLTRPNPLFARAYALAPANGSAVTIPPLTRPVVIGMPANKQQATGFVSANRYSNTFWRRAWRRTSSTNLSQAAVTKQRYEFNSDPEDLIDITDMEADDAPAFLIEGELLP